MCELSENNRERKSALLHILEGIEKVSLPAAFMSDEFGNTIYFHNTHKQTLSIQKIFYISKS